LNTFTKHYQSVQKIKTIQVGKKNIKFSLTDKAVYFYLWSWIESSGEAFPSLKRITDDLGTSKSTVQRAIDNLVIMGIVSKTQRYDNSCIYYVTPPNEVIALSSGEPPLPIPDFFHRVVDRVLALLKGMENDW
jgi:DNA-binding MarR family transcriptional regulator